ncbi:MAG TPA: hypothetical protein VKB38_14770 [Terracidiphilus sp.]|nr:hypothetical protein [Terracidiphilus sp.]
MTNEAQRNIDANPPAPQRAWPPPGLAAIGLYMFILAGTIVLGVVSAHFRPVYLLFAVVFMAAGAGLLLLFRWAWVLALAAVVLIAGMFLWRFSQQRDFPSLAQGLLNMVFFLYLVRPELRARLR